MKFKIHWSWIMLMVVLVSFAKSQNQHSCCNATEAFAMLGHDPEFLLQHEPPLKPPAGITAGQMISIPSTDGMPVKAYEVKAAKPTKNFLFIFQEFWGLNEFVKKESDRLQADLQNVTVIALDLYDGKVASTREEAVQFMQAVKEERIGNIIAAVYSYAGKKAVVQTLGWCFGGGWSLQAALAGGERNTGCVMYYGMPEKDVEKIKQLHGPVLGIFASKDQWINSDVVREFENNLRSARRSFTIKTYDADHAFANPSNPNYDSIPAQQAYDAALQFLKSNFK